MNISFLNSLNGSQYEAVTTIKGPVLVIAGAGSGKTKVIENRCSYLVKNGVRPGSILLLTFTRRAAREMIERATKNDARCRGIDGGTFHSFASRILRHYADTAGIKPNFIIWDDGDTEDAIKRCLKRVIPADAVEDFLNKDELASLFSICVNKDMTLEEAARERFSKYKEYMPNIKKIHSIYTKMKKAGNALDYDDLLAYLKKVLDDTAARKQLAARYEYIMVDEYQDTNKIQSDIVFHLASHHRNIMAVGDDAQSIYAFRGSVVANILQFPDKFDNCKVISLEQNYRSTQDILDTGNCVLNDMKCKFDKELISATGKRGDSPALIEFDDSWHEARWIADMVERHNENGVRLRDIAVLFRSTYVSIQLQTELVKRGITYKVFGGKKLTDSGHVRDLMSILKAFHSLRNELAWTRALSLIPGVGAKTAAKVIEAIAAEESIEAAAECVVEIAGKGKSKDAINNMKDLYIKMSKTDSPSEQVKAALKYYLPVMKKKYTKVGKRERDLSAIKNMADRYEQLGEFLSDLTVDADEAKEDNSIEYLTLSTVHSAKGLEWGKVFLIGLQDGVFPSLKSSSDEEIEEEKRLLYVAVTRAKEELHLCYNARGDSVLSRFICGDVMESIDVVDAPPDSSEYGGQWRFKVEGGCENEQHTTKGIRLSQGIY